MKFYKSLFNIMLSHFYVISAYFYKYSLITKLLCRSRSFIFFESTMKLQRQANPGLKRSLSDIFIIFQTFTFVLDKHENYKLAHTSNINWIFSKIKDSKFN